MDPGLTALTSGQENRLPAAASQSLPCHSASPGPSLVGSNWSALGSILENVSASLRWGFGLVWFCGDED